MNLTLMIQGIIFREQTGAPPLPPDLPHPPFRPPLPALSPLSFPPGFPPSRLHLGIRQRHCKKI
jgi:hypothetical protein